MLPIGRLNGVLRSAAGSALTAMFLLLFMSGCGAKVRTAPEHGDPIANFPKIEVGDLWVEEVDNDVVQLRVVTVFPDKGFLVERKSQSTGAINRITFDDGFRITKVDPNTIRRGTASSVGTVAPSMIDRPYLNFPLFVGKKWEEEINEGGQPMHVEYLVDKFDQISTTAGKISAFRINARFSTLKTGISEDTYWYSPQVKFFVKRNPMGTIRGSLLSYHHPGRTPPVEYFSGTVMYLGGETGQPKGEPGQHPGSPSARPDPVKPNTYWSIVVGISSYQDSRIPALRYAADDALAVYEWLIAPDGGKHSPSRVKLLTNESATGAAIKNALFEWLRQAIAEDVVVIYFSGHGSADSPDSRENLFLLPYDTDYDSIATTGFPMWDIETALKRFIKAKKVIVMADACHAGGVGKPFDVSRKAGRGITVTPVSTMLHTLSTVSDGVCIISASDDNQFSQEGAEWGGGHGVFTHYLLKGLGGEADYNQDGVIRLGEIIPYLSENVRRATKNAQSPTVAGRFDPALSISK